MSFKVTDRVTWIGKTDWELKKFHGEEYSIHRGSSYNSYLVRDEKIALIDTVWMPFAKEYLANLEQELDLDTIDFVIASHAECDHSGALPELMKKIPGKPVYCTNNGIKSLRGNYHADWNFVPVKTGDTLDLGQGKLVFIEAPMLHWPDSMFSYYTAENILFSNDAFGQHLATGMMFNDKVDQGELYQEALKYYANILTPFSALVTKKIQQVLSLNLPVDLICPAHGVIWRDNPAQIISQYLKWADNYQENQITLIYDTMWNGTKHMAEAIAAGIRSVDDEVVIKLFNTGKKDKNDVISEVFKSKIILAGSSTINKGVLFSMAGILEMIKGMAFKNKKAAAFGCYGWSGESVAIITEELKKAGLELIDDGLRAQWNPDDEAVNSCFAYGQKIGVL